MGDQRQRLVAGMSQPPPGYPTVANAASGQGMKKRFKCRLHDRKAKPKGGPDRGCLGGCLAALCCCCLLDECCCDPTIIIN